MNRKTVCRRPMRMPNFLIIGAQKSGTTALYHYLKQHPEVYMSPLKEPGFFAFEGQQPAFTNLKGELSKTSRTSITSLADYQALFQGRRGEKAAGEASIVYLFVPATAACIKQYLPEVRLIAMLRNPIDRAYSAFTHALRDNLETVRDFERALELEESRIRNNCEFLFRYTSMGFYYAQLKRYFDVFDRDQIRVYLYDDLRTDLPGTLHDIFRFLGVDARFTPDMSALHNASGVPKNRLLHRATNVLLLKSDRARRLPEPFKVVLSSPFVSRTATKVRAGNLTKPPFPGQAREALGAVFREDILRLQDLLARDLSPWLS